LHDPVRVPRLRSDPSVIRLLPSAIMAKDASFDITTSVDLQEVDNAVNQASKEIAQRYDFKDAKLATVELNRAEGLIKLSSDTDMRLRAMWDILQTKLIKRGVPVKNLDAGEPVPGGGDTWHRDIKLKQALDSETCKKVVAAIKAQKFKKIQASIQGDTVRVVSPSKDELQTVMTFLRAEDFDVQLSFGNYR
jgi:cyclic-di-GMP-binding protein